MYVRRLIPALALAVALSTGSALADDAQPKKAAEQPAKRAVVTKRKTLTRPAPKNLAEALRRLQAIRVDVDFREMPLPDAVKFIAQVSGFNVIVGPELQLGAEGAIPEVTLKLKSATLKQVAELVARFTETKLAFNNGILSFTTPEAARGKPVLRIYSIGDLTARIRNFPGPDMNLRPSGAEFEDEEESDVENALADSDKITEMLQEFVEAESWSDDGVSVWSDNRKLIVRQYPQVHRKIARFLALLRAAK